MEDTVGQRNAGRCGAADVEDYNNHRNQTMPQRYEARKSSNLCCDCARRGELGFDLQHCWVSGERFHIHHNCTFQWAERHYGRSGEAWS